ncbi:MULTISPECIES: acyl-CoA thioesterase [Xanthobacter]|uniref:acyl-CoA thioesterase n=1 Tax=Xanthobacter TaxID=279 RepID=UPI001F3C52B3|nr:MULTISPECIES: thioesterase family protein [unclassified Xanthobacter]
MTAPSSPPEKAPLPTLDDFPLKSFDTIRFGDTDKQGHVNNAVFSSYLESGRSQMLLGPGHSAAPEGFAFVIVRLVLDYRAEIIWPGTVDIGTRVSNLGRSSVGIVQGLFQDGKCVATADTVLVLFDPQTRRAAELPPESRAFLSQYM